MVTSSRQINFWGKQAGASEAVLAREIPSAELFVMAENLQIPAEVLVYGASIITIRNDRFFRIITTLSRQKSLWPKIGDLFLAEPGDPNSHYSVYEDKHGTHIFSNNDLNMMTKLSELVDMALIIGNSMVSTVRVKTLSRLQSTLSRPVIWFKKEHLHRIKPICLMKKSANYIQLIVVWILVSMIMNQIV